VSSWAQPVHSLANGLAESKEPCLHDDVRTEVFRGRRSGMRTPNNARLRFAIGVLRLRRCFAERSRVSAQDDTLLGPVIELSALKIRWLTGSGATSRFCIRTDVSRSSMKRWRWLLLIFELTLFAVILILPQVDLPDFTFQAGNAPVAAHARVCRTAPAHAIAALPKIEASHSAIQPTGEVLNTASPSALQSRLSRLCVLLC